MSIQRISALVSLLLVTLSLCACIQFLSAEQKTTQTACIATCEQRAAACTKVCRNNCRQCQARAGQSTSESYLYYQHEQFVKCDIVARQLNSYRDPLQCRKVTCSCSADYQICMQSCGSGIKKQLRVAPVCQ